MWLFVLRFSLPDLLATSFGLFADIFFFFFQYWLSFFEKEETIFWGVRRLGSTNMMGVWFSPSTASCLFMFRWWSPFPLVLSSIGCNLLLFSILSIMFVYIEIESKSKGHSKFLDMSTAASLKLLTSFYWL